MSYTFKEIVSSSIEGIDANVYFEQFNLFSATSGLQTSKPKSELFCSGMKDAEIVDVLSASGFTRGKLPFKYLGVPICSKRISVSQCEVLVEKMTARIRVWSSRNVSYARRLQLINSVLMSIHMYWSQVFILPRTVLQAMVKICRAYLWYGSYHSLKSGGVSWQDVCKKKKQGGLGVKNVDLINLANMGRHVWAVAKKQDSMWIRWVNAVYIKHNKWETYKPPIDSSWYWKKVCEVKDGFIQKIVFKDLMEMQIYSTKKMYNLLEEDSPNIYWAQNIWSRLVVPKYRICAWLALKQRLKVRSRLIQFGVCDEDSCLLSRNGEETHEHLFLNVLLEV